MKFYLAECPNIAMELGEDFSVIVDNADDLILVAPPPTAKDEPQPEETPIANNE